MELESVVELRFSYENDAENIVWLTGLNPSSEWRKGEKSLGNSWYTHKNNWFIVDSWLSRSVSIEEQMDAVVDKIEPYLDQIKKNLSKINVELKVVIYSRKANFWFQLSQEHIEILSKIKATVDADQYSLV